MGGGNGAVKPRLARIRTHPKQQNPSRIQAQGVANAAADMVKRHLRNR